MNIDPQDSELRHVVQQTHNMVIQIAKDQAYMRGELVQINERLASLENRMTSLETRMTSLETRMSNVETRVSDVESRVSKEIRDVFKWLIGMMIPVWLGLIAALIIQLLKTG